MYFRNAEARDLNMGFIQQTLINIFLRTEAAMKKEKLMKLVSTMCLAGVLSLSSMIPAQTVAASDETTDVFFDDFTGESLDTEKWLIAEKTWGGFNGGVVSKNVSVSDGTLKLEGHGNLYQGDVEGVNKQLSGGIRTGAAIATKEYYSSGSYEIVAKVAPELGACSAIWTFEYEEYYPGSAEYEALGATGSYATVNHEIDIELPTATSTHSEPNFSSVRFNTYIAENRCHSYFMDLPYAQDDGKFHTYRFDWHTGDIDEEARVDFYIDDQYLYTSKKYIPTNASRLWVGLWFPSAKDSDHDGYGDSGWTGTANFDTTVFEIDSVKITPYHEQGDTIGKESYPEHGWAKGTVIGDSNKAVSETSASDLLSNSDFAEGTTAWDVSGSAQITEGAAYLASGSDTDTISQKVAVEGATQYTLIADIEKANVDITIGVMDYNGRYTKASETSNKAGKIFVPFVTAGHIREVEAFATVLRYQDSNEAVVLKNLRLVRGFVKENEESTSTEELIVEVPTIEEPVVEEPTVEENKETEKATNLLLNGDFSQGAANWKQIGSAQIKDEAAYLASGRDTDIVEQRVTVLPNTGYTLTGDILSSGSTVEFIVSDYNGKYTHISESYTSDGVGTVSFTTGKDVTSIKVKLQVLRYQDNSDPVIVDNLVLSTQR